MIGNGWANNCGTELFTIGWVTCEGTDVPVPAPEVGRTTYGGFIPAKEPWIDKRKLIEQDDNEIISILVAAINAGVIR